MGKPRQRIRFCQAPDGVRIALAESGEGPPIVKAANYLTHLEFDWDSPVWRHWLDALSSDHRLIRYDERGCGLSDWDIEDFSLDAWVADLETVVDSLRLERFPLLGISQGEPLPSRTRCGILSGLPVWSSTERMRLVAFVAARPRNSTKKPSRCLT